MKATKTGIALSTMAAWFTEAAYAVSPIDLIPDIIPVLGLLDDFFGFLLVLAFTGYAVYRWRRVETKSHDLTVEQNMLVEECAAPAIPSHSHPIATPNV